MKRIGKRRRRPVLYSKHRVRTGEIIINLLPWITALGLAAGTGFAIHSFRGEIVDTYNQWKLEHEMTRSQDDSEEVELNDNTAIDLDHAVVVVNDTEEEQESLMDNIAPSKVYAADVDPEPVIYPEETSSELLDSGYEFLDIDFDSLKEQCEDVVGWIEIPGTKVNYVVVQGGDNDYYLHHDINGGNSSNGTIFIDSRVDLNLGDDSSSVQYSPIGFYGHHMRSGKMFKTVCNYKQQSYLDNHPFAVYYSPEGVYKLDFFADQYVAGDSDEGLFTNQLYDESQFDDFINNIISNSKISNPDVEVEYGDKVGYLVTCTYEQDNLRYALWYKASKQYTNEIDRQNDIDNAKTLSLN